MSEHSQMTASDHQLVIAAQSGSLSAQRDLVRRFHPRVIRCLQYHAGTGAPVEDLAQDCWTAVLSRLQHLELQVCFNAFILTIARRRAIDWIRKEQRHRVRRASDTLASDMPATPPDENDTEGKLARIHEGILQLPATQRVVLSMFYLENRCIREIAEGLQISEGTVKSRLFHAREALKKQLSKKDGGEK